MSLTLPRRRRSAPADPPPPVAPPGATPAGSHVLAVLCAALALVVSGVASLNIALPAIARDLGATQTQLQWIVDAYALVFAALLLPAGALGDRLGRKRMLVAGLVVLAVAYALALLAATADALVAARAAAGIGAAAVMPVTLSVITTVFHDEDRDRAVAVWAGVAGAGAIAGLLLSGVLLEVASWEWVFGVNAAWAALVVVAVVRVVPATGARDETALDPAGAVLSAAGLGAVVFAVIEAPRHGWLDAVTVGALGGGAALLGAFVAWELRRDEPMLDVRLFADPRFAAGALAITLQFFALFGLLFVLLQHVQLVLGWSPLEAALGMVPMAAALVAVSRGAAPRAVRRHGAGRSMAAGLLSMAVGFVVMSGLDASSSYWHLLAGLLLLGTGAGMSTTPATTSIVGSLPAAKQGVASAVNDASREVGGALGIAVLGSVLADVYRSGVADATRALPPDAREAAGSSLAFVAERLGAPVLDAARASFADGLAAALLAGAGVLVLAAVAVTALTGRARPAAAPPHRGAAPPEPAAPPPVAASAG